mmetsp:Transcript_50010/g.133370  ORF Transcript_50010/g.133370 Transcript_50010/m.133370 type:complete len:121 (+) Transcript_50010:87-449(+)
MAAELAERRAIDAELRDWKHFVEPPKYGALFGDRFCTDPVQGCYVADCFVEKDRVRHREVDLVYRRAHNIKVVEEDLPFIAWLAGVDRRADEGVVIDNRSWRELYELRQVEKSQWMVEVQ